MHNSHHNNKYIHFSNIIYDVILLLLIHMSFHLIFGEPDFFLFNKFDCKNIYTLIFTKYFLLNKVYF